MACTKKFTMDALYDCLDKPIKGIDGSKAVLINREDIDYSASTVAGAVITDLVLKVGATGYALQWYKDLANSGSTFVKSTEDQEGHTNNFIGRLATTTSDHAERARELAGGRFVIVYESKYKGTDGASAFKVRGWDNGMTLSEMTENTNENSGSILFTLATDEGETELYPYRIFNETNYATSKATFDALFATV